MNRASVFQTPGVLTASALPGGLVIGALCCYGVLPLWTFQACCIGMPGVCWYRFIRRVWPKLPSRQQGWLLFWSYAAPFCLILPLAALWETGNESLWNRVAGRLTAALLAGTVIAFIYDFIYKNKPNMRKKIIAGNWKMNMLPSEGVELAKSIVAGRATAATDVHFIVCPPFTHLSQVAAALEGSDIALGAQNCAAEAKGAYTGEVSAAMLAALGCKYVILGHSERRQYYGETSAMLRQKMEQAYDNDLVPIYCVGENLEEREAGKHFDVVKAQLEEVVYHLSDGQFSKLLIAYEPVWAIGTGKTATAEQAQEIHAYIRKALAEKFGSAAQDTAILYGGSCKPSNAAEIFAKEDVDGGLIGGAALKADDFLAIGQGFGR